MNYLKMLAACVLLVCLGACTTLGDVVNDIGVVKTVAAVHVTNPVTDKEVALVGSAYGAAAGVVVGYASLPACAVGTAFSIGNPCHDRALLVALDRGMHTAFAAYGQLVTFQRAHPTGSTVVGGSPTDLISQARAAVAALVAVEKAHNMEVPS